MSDPTRDPDRDDGTFEALRARAVVPPPPGAALLAAVANLKPVSTRRRTTAWLLVTAAAAVLPAAMLARGVHRPDLGALPVAWVAAGALAWGAAALVLLYAALVPRAGDVLPAAGRASRASLVGLGALLAFGLAWSWAIPGASPDSRGGAWHAALDCGGFVLEAAAIVVVLGFVALRKLRPLGGARIGLAIGAAGGATGALALHFVCPLGGAAHVVGAHVGGVIAAGLAAAALLRTLFDRG